MKSEKDYDMIDILIAIHRSKETPTPFKKTADLVQRSTSTIYERYKRLIKKDPIGLALEVSSGR